ncbi:hypothetical protein D3C76_1388710 [compost metagenome]
MAAQGVERFVVLFLFQVRQLMHHNHAQKGFRCVAEHGRHADLGFGFQLAALHVLQHVDLVVVHHLIDRRGALQVPAFQILRILPEGFIGGEIVGPRVAFFQHRAQLLLGNQAANLRK